MARELKRPKKIWPKIALTTALLILGGYTVYETGDYLRGPGLIILTPQTGELVATNLAIVRGSARRISHLFLNGRLIFTDESGQFSEKLLLAPGYNIIRLEARDKFGRRVNQTLHLTYGEKT